MMILHCNLVILKVILTKPYILLKSIGCHLFGSSSRPMVGFTGSARMWNEDKIGGIKTTKAEFSSLGRDAWWMHEKCMSAEAHVRLLEVLDFQYNIL